MEQKVKCLNCGSENSAAQQFCGVCGAKLPAALAQPTMVSQQKIKCPNCGSQNLAGQQFCGTCGARLVEMAAPSPVAEVRPLASHKQIEVKPTWGLAWGLWWRGLLLTLLIGGIAFLIFVIITVLGLGWGLKSPIG